MTPGSVRGQVLLAYDSLYVSSALFRLLNGKGFFKEDLAKSKQSFPKGGLRLFERKIQEAYKIINDYCFTGKTNQKQLIKAWSITNIAIGVLNTMVEEGMVIENLEKSTKLVTQGGLVQIKEDLLEAYQILDRLVSKTNPEQELDKAEIKP